MLGTAKGKKRVIEIIDPIFVLLAQLVKLVVDVGVRRVDKTQLGHLIR